jgi:hypothetical protein
MKKIDLGQTIGILANLGVLIGILLLVAELNQNRQLTRAQTRNELSRGLTDLLSLTAGDHGLSDMVVRADRGEELTPTESYRLSTRSELVFRYWENVHYQYRQGLYDESEFSRHRDTIEFVLNASPSLITSWCEERLLYSVPFMTMIDELVDGKAC